jgi:glycosyltransferase involved in cell wall biosynthesis
MTARRVTVVASEVLGLPGTGGPGTADSFLAIALGRHGHDVELLIAPGRDITRLSPTWERTFTQANVRVRPLAGDRPVQPSFLGPAWHVYEALRANPPDVVIADDWRALAYAGLRSRQLGLALTETAFVAYCHGPARVFAAAARKVPDTLARFGEELAQRACLELADVVVSPSEWLVGWLRDHRWPVRQPASVIQNLSQSVALEETFPVSRTGSRIRRLAFFGQLREGKGIRVFIASLRKLDPTLLDDIELVFLGHTRSWTEQQIRAELGSRVVEGLRSIRVETQLDRTAAIDELKTPGTLAVMPSWLENSPYAVAECIEHGIPFLASDVGGTAELVAHEDRARVLCAPTPDDFAAALERALASETGLAPAAPARAPEESLAAWVELIQTVVPTPRSGGTTVAEVAVVASGGQSADRARRLAEHTRSVRVDVIPAESRAHGLEQATAEWVLFLDETDIPDDKLIDVLVAAQAAAGADVVTTAVRDPNDLDGALLFLGDPGPLGLIENQYGVIGLVRRSLASADSDWLLFARLALAGRRIVSIPDPLAVHAGRPAAIGDSPAEGLAVLEAFEANGAMTMQELPQFAATLGASLARREAAQLPPSARSRFRRIRRRLLR